MIIKADETKKFNEEKIINQIKKLLKLNDQTKQTNKAISTS